MDKIILGSKESLALLIESAPVAVVTIEKSGHIIFVNAKLEEMFGYHRSELIGQRIETLIPSRLRDLHTVHRANYMVEPHIRPMGTKLELVARRQDGSEFPVEVGLSFLKMQGDLLVQALITDITNRKQAQMLLERRVDQRTQEIERRRQVAANLRDILAMLNSNHSLDDLLNYVVAQATHLLGANASAIYQLDEPQQQLILKASYGLPANYEILATATVDQDKMAQALATHQPTVIANLLTMIPIRTVARLSMEQQILLVRHYRAKLSLPLTIKDKLYGELALYYTEPQQFTKEEVDLAVTFSDQIVLTIENAYLRIQVEQAAVAAERNRLARDLHDSVTQTLFSASVIAEVLPRLWKRNQPEAKRRSDELRRLTRGALAEMRTLLLELRPSTLTEVALSDLLEQLTEATTERGRIPVTLDIQGKCTLQPKVQVALYRIAQEALNNIVKHARATQAVVCLEHQIDQVKLVVADDGRGFLTEGVEPDRLGLNIMRERAEKIGANLTIDSQPNEGTTITLIWPRQLIAEKHGIGK